MLDNRRSPREGFAAKLRSSALSLEKDAPREPSKDPWPNQYPRVGGDVCDSLSHFSSKGLSN